MINKQTQKLTRQDLAILTLMTNYLFCDNIGEAIDYANAVTGEAINAFTLQNREIQAKVKGAIWDDFLKIKKKLKELVK